MNFKGRHVMVTGGSSGLGKELALLAIQRGANVTIVARSELKLGAAQLELQSGCHLEKQWVRSISVNLSDYVNVQTKYQSLSSAVDVLICTAGGATNQNGYFVELTSQQHQECMSNNYFSAIFISQICLRAWLDGDTVPYSRHIVFIASTAAFVGVPGYTAYTPTKVALRSVADTLRQELLMYGGTDKYQVHCAFPGTFASDALLNGIDSKPELTKRIEGLGDETSLLRQPSSRDMASKIFAGIEQREFMITTDLQGRAMLNNMRGPSPRDSWFLDAIMGLFVPIIWLFYRLKFDAMARECRS